MRCSNWASKASPTLGCSIAISRDIYVVWRRVGYARLIWASEASPTLGCSIEISRDIYVSVCMYVCMSVVCQINCIGGIT